MKFWLYPRRLPYYSINHRYLPCNTLPPQRRACLCIYHPHLPRCKQRLTPPSLPCKRRVILLFCHIYPHWPRTILWVILIHLNMILWCSHIYSHYGHSLPRLCTPLRTNKLLSSNSNHKLFLCHSHLRKSPSRVSVRRVCSNNCNTNTLFYISFHPPLHADSPSSNPLNFPPRNRIKQPSRD